MYPRSERSGFRQDLGIRFSTAELVVSDRLNCAIRTVLLVAGLVATGFVQATGNIGNFTRAENGVVDYRHILVHRSARDCVLPALASLPDSEVLGAEWIAENGNDPAYCKVTGLIQAAVRWVSYLPADWNGRLYMHGNGGNAGEALDFAGYHRVRLNAVPNADGFMEQAVIVDSWFQYLAFDEDDPKRDWHGMNPARDSASMERMRGLLQAKNPQLSPFAARGGKLIIYHGWADFGVDPLTTIAYVNAVSEVTVQPREEFLRLYLVPGMFHCGGGTNVDSFDLISPLIDWVEKGQKPPVVTANRIEDIKVTRSRPLCAYPAIARYKGSGDPDRADSFSCR